MDTVFIISEYSGVGDFYGLVAAYPNHELATKHVEMARHLFPRAANKLVIKELSVLEKIEP